MVGKCTPGRTPGTLDINLYHVYTCKHYVLYMYMYVKWSLSNVRWIVQMVQSIHQSMQVHVVIVHWVVYGEMMYSGDGRIPILYLYILSEVVR